MTDDVLGPKKKKKKNLKIGTLAKMETVRSYVFLGSLGKGIHSEELHVSTLEGLHTYP